MTEPRSDLPAAGWYPDPERPGQLRWWDGTAWTEHRHDPRPPTGSVPTARVAPAAAVAAPEGGGPGAGRRDGPVEDWRHAPPPQVAATPTRSPASGGARGQLSLGWASVVVATWFGSQLVSGVLLGAGVALGGGDLEDPTSLAVLTLVTLLVSLAAVVGLLRWRLGSWSAVLGERSPALGWLVGGAALGLLSPLAIGLGTDVVARWLEVPLPDEPSQAILADLIDAPPPVVAMTFVFVVLLAPVLEELVFRRALYASLAARLGVGLAVLVSAVVFAVVHVELFLAGAFGLLQLVGLVLLGAAFAWLYERTRSAWPPILAHAAFNLLSLVAVLIAA